MMYGVLFALLGLCQACFREGVWTKYTPEDVARWQAEAAQAAPATLHIHRPHTPPLTQPGPTTCKPERPAARPQVRELELVP